jgi:hypothetical protein
MTTEELAALFAEGWAYRLEDRPQGATIVELERTLQHGGEVLRTVEVRPVRGVHARQAPDSWDSHDGLLSMAGLLTGLPDVVLDGLSGGDLAGVLDAVQAQLWPLLELPAAHANMPEPEVGEERKPHHRVPVPALPAPFTLELEKRASAGGDAVSRLEFRAVTGKDCRGLPNSLQIRHLPRLVEKLAGITPAIFDALEGRDLQRALGVAQCFFVGTRRTGRAPSPS